MANEHSKDLLSIEEFGRFDIRIGRITAAEKVPETDRLIKFNLDFGDEQRTIIGGWAISYSDPSLLVDTLVPAILNLEPRTIRGIESQGMLLSAALDGQPIAIHPEKDVPLGTEIR